MNWADDNHSRWKDEELRRAEKIDLNQPEIVEALRALPGVIVRSLAGLGDGINDLLVITEPATFLIEVKMPGETLTPKQKDWHRECRWRNHVAYDVESAVAIAKYYLGKKVA